MRAVLGQVPVLSNLRLALTKLHQVPSWQLSNTLENGVRVRDATEIEVLQQTFGIDLR